MAYTDIQGKEINVGDYVISTSVAGLYKLCCGRVEAINDGRVSCNFDIFAYAQSHLDAIRENISLVTNSERSYQDVMRLSDHAVINSHLLICVPRHMADAFACANVKQCENYLNNIRPTKSSFVPVVKSVC